MPKRVEQYDGYTIYTPGTDCDCDECLSYAPSDVYDPHTPDWEPIGSHPGIYECSCGNTFDESLDAAKCEYAHYLERYGIHDTMCDCGECP